MSNPISPELKTGTIGELLVQTRLLQYNVQAAPPLKDSGNDLIAIRESAIRRLQVKTTDLDHYRKPDKKKKYDILAAVRLVGCDQDISLDKCEIYLIKKKELVGLSLHFSKIPQFKLSSDDASMLINALFPLDT